ncbi:mechanosensitive ion channel family protein [Mesorhizobium sp. ZMM04-4]
MLALVICLCLIGSGQAQPAPSDVPPEKVNQFLALLNDPEVATWLEHRSAERPATDTDSSVAGTVEAVEATLRARLAGLLAAIPRLPAEFAKVAEVTARDVNAGRPGIVLIILAVLVVIGLAAEWLVRHFVGGRVRDSSRPSLATFAAEFAALLAFSLASFGSFVAFDWPPLLRKVVLTLLAATVAYRLVRTFAGLALALAGDDAEGGGPDSQKAVADRFWRRRTSVIAGILLFGWAIVSIVRALGMSPDAVRLVAYLLGIGLLAAGFEIVWHRPEQAASTLKRVLLSLFLLVLWLAWMAGMSGLLWLGIFALVLPGFVRGAGQLAQALAGTARPVGISGVVIDVLIDRGARALVIAAAVAWMAYLWRSDASILAGSEFGDRLIGGALNAVIIFLIADLVWQLSKGLINYRLSAEALATGSDEQIARAARLRTLLPIFRNVLSVFIVVVSALTILSGLGVQIGPLIAGAGIFGVAIGFGSQTLVKDVLSGVFFMLDDAFRVGEYIQSGSYKGTVESFSLRSVRLRHHRGPIYTVPFGALGAIENMSRDWVIDKMVVRVTYDSDVDLARKLIRTIGQELAADPEFAADTIEPLKMQGIDNFGDFAIELKMKLKTKPNTQFKMKRQALMMIRKAFAENGIKIAVPTVQVEGGGDRAAAAQQAINDLKPAVGAADLPHSI